MQRLGRYAKWLDRLLKPRLSVFVEGIARYFIAGSCLFIAVVMPPMELVPLSANIAGIALTAFGLALIARDGLFALIAFCFTAGGLVVATSALL
ncbi:exopolysaccharide biosynthesis protein [Pseudomonas sp. Q2-TVG4-2]|uniref:exopolysaccharide biosynthesis protein n=1 Tax=Pseudomonas sp. Q2-TVG4-2 TaxID=1685699 RepID=UPI0035C6D8E3